MTLDNFQPVAREQSLSVRVAAHIEEMIRNGELKVGDRIQANKKTAKAHTKTPRAFSRDPEDPNCRF